MEMGLLSRIATNDGHGENSSYFDGWKAYDNDPYHHVDNPNGVIQMGLAENQLCHDLMVEWIKEHPTASICTVEGASQFKDVAIFQDYHGLPLFIKAVAQYMEKVRGGRVKVKPERIVMSGGATGAQEIMAFCLADPGDAFLIPTPFYPAFARDFCWRTGVKLLPVHCKSSNNFQITREALETEYEKAEKSNTRVKGLLITNPSNPLGTMMEKDTLKELLQWTNEKKIHLVCDEIFAGTVFGKGTEFTSVAQVLEEETSKTKYDPNLLHIVCSLSKDLGMPGFRVGIVYSYNDNVVKCGRRMSSFGLVSTQTQHLLASMLADNDFTSKLMIENAKRLHDRHEKFTSGLAEVGVRCLSSNAGLFCWMDLRRLLESDSVESENKLWRIIIDEVKLNVSPGSSFHCSEAGWFRVCFANMDSETMEEALERIRKFVFRVSEEEEKKKEKEKEKKKKKFERRLSLPKRFDEMVFTPRGILSPRSPLVKAT
ncbi:putative 1-aminocyclopropane-1-carboxylate synthase [Dioscorea sansibarensis]